MTAVIKDIGRVDKPLSWGRCIRDGLPYCAERTPACTICSGGQMSCGATSKSVGRCPYTASSPSVYRPPSAVYTGSCSCGAAYCPVSMMFIVITTLLCQYFQWSATIFNRRTGLLKYIILSIIYTNHQYFIAHIFDSSAFKGPREIYQRQYMH